MMSRPSIEAATLSIFSWPYGCSTSAGRSARRTAMNAITDATRSMDELRASDRIAIDPVMIAAASLITISVAL